MNPYYSDRWVTIPYKDWRWWFMEWCPSCNQFGWNLYRDLARQMDENWEIPVQCKKCGAFNVRDCSGW